MALTIDAQLGSQEITALLGKSSIGEVYLARGLKVRREAAIKILPRNSRGMPVESADFNVKLRHSPAYITQTNDSGGADE